MSVSIAAMSDENRLRTRPRGLASNQPMLVRTTALAMSWCNDLEAARDPTGSSTLRSKVTNIKVVAATQYLQHKTLSHKRNKFALKKKQSYRSAALENVGDVFAISSIH
jgi:hypothetical protein